MRLESLRKAWRKLGLLHHITLTLTLLLILMAIVVIDLLRILDTTQALQMHFINTDAVKLARVSEIEAGFHYRQRLLSEMLTDTEWNDADKTRFVQFMMSRTQYHRQFEDIEIRMDHPLEQQALASLRQATANTAPSVFKAIELAQTGHWNEAIALHEGQVKASFTLMQQAWVEMHQAIMIAQQEELASLQQIQAKTRQSTWLYLAAMATLALLLIGLARRNIGKTVREMSAWVHEIGTNPDQAHSAQRVDPAFAEMATEVAHMADHLRQSTTSLSFLNAVLDAMGKPMAILDAQGRVLRCNQALAELQGVTPVSLVGQPWHTFIEEEEEEEEEEEVALQHAMHNIPQLLAQQPEYFYRLFATSPLALLIADAAGQIQIANPAAYCLLGYASEALNGQPLSILLPDSLRAAHEAHLRAFATHPSARRMNPRVALNAVTQTGDLLPLHISLIPWPGEFGLKTLAILQPDAEYALWPLLRLNAFGRLFAATPDEAASRITLRRTDSLEGSQMLADCSILRDARGQMHAAVLSLTEIAKNEARQRECQTTSKTDPLTTRRIDPPGL